MKVPEAHNMNNRRVKHVFMRNWQKATAASADPIPNVYKIVMSDEILIIFANSGLFIVVLNLFRYN